MGPILFSGSPGPTAQRGPEDLDAINAHVFSRLLNQWIARIWANRPEAARRDSNSFDRLPLIPEFRQSYPRDWSALNRGASIEEVWLQMELMRATPARCLINTTFSGQPSGRISRKTLLEPSVLALSLKRWLTYPRPECHAMVRTGPHSGHSILLLGTDPGTGWFGFWDPWPGTSLLSASNNTVGIDAVADKSRPGLWLVSAHDLEANLVAVMLDEDVWQSWLMYDQLVESWPTAQALASGGSVEDVLAAATLANDAELPPRPWDPLEPPQPLGPEHTFDVASTWVSIRSFDAVAVATAAARFAQQLQSAGHGEEAITWYRQSAMIVQSEAVEALVAALRRSGQIGEADYWVRRSQQRVRIELPSTEELERLLAADGRSALMISQISEWEADIRGAELNRGINIEENGELKGAESLYRQIAETADGEAAGHAANRLGWVLEKLGDPDGARQAYRSAAESGWFTAAAHGWANLGLLLTKLGEHEAADEADRSAVESGHFEVAPRVGLVLGSRLMTEERLQEARDVLERSVYSNDAFASAGAALVLGAVLASDDLPQAKIMWRRALTSPDEETATLARSALRELRRRRLAR